jgi:hypothetical protein
VAFLARVYVHTSLSLCRLTHYTNVMYSLMSTLKQELAVNDVVEAAYGIIAVRAHIHTVVYAHCRLLAAAAAAAAAAEHTS